MEHAGHYWNYLDSHHVMTLATHGPDGPWAAAVFYAREGGALYFLSAPTTRHCRNIEHDPQVAAAIQEDYAHWKEIKGIQIEGKVARLSGADRDHAAAVYARKFEFMHPLRIPSALAVALQKIAWYRLTPTAAYFIDNSRGFGKREQIELPGG